MRDDSRQVELAEKLSAIAEEISDLAYEQLWESAESGATKIPPELKRLARAQRAVQKAAHLLRPEDDTLD